MNTDDANITLDKIWELKTTSDDESKLKLIQQIESQAFFIDVALNEPNSGVRKRAVLKMAIKFHEELMIISLLGPFWEIRLIALKKLHPMYQNHFIQICITEEFSKIRKLAQEKLRFTD
ncbi:MAG: hypothetical protein IH840_07415 [Candidatus Heimdallarchaeota archaeon]|nr:hypothetical protein [Candidatus Heimdallarchaeota archaeon]